MTRVLSPWAAPTLTLPTFPAALAVQKLLLIKTFILFPILLCRGCRRGSLAISLIDNSVFLCVSGGAPGEALGPTSLRRGALGST